MNRRYCAGETEVTVEPSLGPDRADAALENTLVKDCAERNSSEDDSNSSDGSDGSGGRISGTTGQSSDTGSSVDSLQ